jgi:RND superfamily putative drug exporter
VTRLTEFVLRHRKLVALGWLLLFLAGAATAGTTSKRLTIDFSLPGQPGYEAEHKILAHYGNGGLTQPIIAVLTGSPATLQQSAAPAFGKLASKVHGVRVVTSPSYVSKDGHTRYALVFYPFPKSFSSKPYDGPVRTALQQLAPPGVHAATTSYDDLSSGGSSSGPGVLAETLFGGLGALAVLAFVFASFLALVPIIVAAVSILTTFLVLLALTYVTHISFIVEFLVALIGLGVAVDYSLIVVNRWREERDHGKNNHDAVVTAMQTAGHAVVFSGLTVAIGLLAVVVLPVPFLRSMGYGGALIPAISVLAACTLLPALLGGIGPRVDWPKIRHENVASKAWTRWSALVVRRRWVATGLAVVVLGLLVIPVFSIKVGLADTDALAKSGESYRTLHQLQQSGVTPGVLTPMEVLVKAGQGDAVAAKLGRLHGVTSAVAQPASLARGGDNVVVVVPDEETVNSTSLGPVHAVQDAVQGDPAVLGVGGAGPVQIDYVNAVYKHFPLVLSVIVVLTYILLARAFRSLLLPLKAVILNLISLAATFGGMVLFWQWGHGSHAIFGIAPTGAITFWLPVLVFAFLYGLSMDYEVFILSRVREEFDRTGSTDRGVIEGVGRTGRLITSAALILFLAFLSLASGPETDIKVLATGLGFGILLDATIIRSLLVPALVSLFGRINWVLPAWAARPLRVEPSLPPNAETSG